MKLTQTQQRAKGKLTARWQCAYSLGESLSTLRALVKAGAAEMRADSLGAIFSPRTATFFRLASAAPHVDKNGMNVDNSKCEG